MQDFPSSSITDSESANLLYYFGLNIYAKFLHVFEFIPFEMLYLISLKVFNLNLVLYKPVDALLLKSLVNSHAWRVS